MQCLRSVLEYIVVGDVAHLYGDVPWIGSLIPVGYREGQREIL